MSRDIVIADLDGTIALIDHRRHWLEPALHPELNSDGRWRAFFAACVEDSPNWPVIHALAGLHALGYQIHIVSGRSDEVRPQTERWLAKHLVPYEQLRMREAGDHTPDEVLKEQWLAEYNKADILAVFDDRPKVVRMWRAQGLFVFDCGNGQEF